MALRLGRGKRGCFVPRPAELSENWALLLSLGVFRIFLAQICLFFCLDSPSQKHISINGLVVEDRAMVTEHISDGRGELTAFEGCVGDHCDLVPQYSVQLSS
jgi:hypothetical protein